MGFLFVGKVQDSYLTFGHFVFPKVKEKKGKRDLSKKGENKMEKSKLSSYSTYEIKFRTYLVVFRADMHDSSLLYSLFPVTHYFLYSLITFGIKVIMQILSSIFPFL